MAFNMTHGAHRVEAHYLLPWVLRFQVFRPFLNYACSSEECATGFQERAAIGSKRFAPGAEV